MSTPNLALAHIAASQTQKEVTANAAFDALDTAITDQQSINCAGSSDVTPASTIADAMVLLLTGLLTGNINLKLPQVKRPYIIRNTTTGAFTITVKTTNGASTGVIVPQSCEGFVYSDGTNVIQVSNFNCSDFVVKTIKFTLSSADILGLDVTPKLVVPAVTGKVLVPLGGAAFYHAGASPYVIGAGEAFVFTNGASIGNNAGFFFADAFITEATDQVASIGVYNATVLPAYGNSTGVALSIMLSYAATLGNGTVDVFLQYAEIQF